MSKTYSIEVAKVESLVAGLKNNVELVRGKGLNEGFINKLEEEITIAAAYNSDAEKLRDDILKKTRQANQKLLEVKSMVKQAKKIVKNDFDITRWKDFGINDKR